MLTEVKFEGQSDDIFMAGGDEFYSPFAVLVTGDNGRLIVRARYDGVWNIGVQPVDEDVSMPDWPARFTLAENGYSACLTLSIPGKATVTHIAGKDDDGDD